MEEQALAEAEKAETADGETDTVISKTETGECIVGLIQI